MMGDSATKYYLISIQLFAKTPLDNSRNLPIYIRNLKAQNCTSCPKVNKGQQRCIKTEDGKDTEKHKKIIIKYHKSSLQRLQHVRRRKYTKMSSLRSAYFPGFTTMSCTSK